MGDSRSALVSGLANQIGATPLSSAEIDAILELAATAAHGTGDRTSAPLASFLAGIAAANAENREQAISEINRQAAELTASSASWRADARLNMEVLVLQHIACEPPGVFEDVLVQRGANIRRVELDEGDALPASLDGFGAVIVMGGPMSAVDEAEHPWLAPEKALLREALSGGVPVWGVCLGVQLLASALGAHVGPGPAPEVGVLPVHPTPAGLADPVFGPCDWPLTALQWHGDTFDLPTGAVVLASSPAYEHQAIRIGELGYGLQFHIEVDAGLADEWSRVPAYVASAERVLGRGGADRLLSDVRESERSMLIQARELFGRWLDLCALRR